MNVIYIGVNHRRAAHKFPKYRYRLQKITIEKIKPTASPDEYNEEIKDDKTLEDYKKGEDDLDEEEASLVIHIEF